MNHTRTRIKICGITREEDLWAAVKAGADAIGFVAYSKSPRYVGPELAAQLARLLPPFVTPVILFVNASIDEVAVYLDAYPAYTLQFHGDERAQECEQYGNPYWKAARMQPGFDLGGYAVEFASAQAMLLDAYSDAYGGAGQTFDWNLIPPDLPIPLILSGGLTPENVGAGIAKVRPWAVDVSSGVEQSKGIKDASKIQSFAAAVKAIDRALLGE
ncbi:MAG: phosphoribosylanthranilate isomerase [Burkholderiales bacterium]